MCRKASFQLFVVLSLSRHRYCYASGDNNQLLSATLVDYHKCSNKILPLTFLENTRLGTFLFPLINEEKSTETERERKLVPLHGGKKQDKNPNAIFHFGGDLILGY